MIRTVGRREAWLGRCLLVVAMILTLLPLLSMLSAALAEPGTTPVGLRWPADPHWGNFVEAFRTSHYTRLLASSAMIAGATVPLTVAFAAMAGFAMGVLRAPGSNPVMIALLFGLTLPLESVITPLYFQIEDMGLLNSRLAVVASLTGAFVPFGTFWMRTHFLGMPTELTEAARIDGATNWQLFSRVHSPLALPAVATLAVLVFLWSWNAFLHPLVLIDDADARTMAGALGAFQGQYFTDTPLLNAAALLVIMPSLAVFVAFQRQFIRGLLTGGVK